MAAASRPGGLSTTGNHFLFHTGGHRDVTVSRLERETNITVL